MSRLAQPRLEITFYKTTPETVTVSDADLVRDSFSFNEQLLNGLEASSNRVVLTLHKDCSAIEKILSYQVDSKAVLYDGTSVLFTGYLSDKYTWKVNDSGEQEFQITIEDIGTKLLGRAFLSSDSPALYNLRGSIYSGNNSILYRVCNRAGISIASNQPNITTEICKNIDKNTTCKDILSQMLLEAGYTFYFNSNGQLCLYKIDCQSVSGIPVIDKDSLYVVGKNAITLTKQVRQYKQVNVNYDEYETRNGVMVYRDITGQDDDHPDCNITIKPNEFYPVPLLEVSTISDMLALDTTETEVDSYVRVTANSNVYLVETLGTAGATYNGTYFSFLLSSVNETSFIEAKDIDKGKEIVYIENVQGTVEFEGSLTYEISQRGAKNLAVVLHNNGSSNTTVTKLQATATVTDIKSNCILIAGEGAASTNSDNVYSTQATYIHKKEYAQTYANLIADYYKYCNYSYQFYCTTDYSLGTIVNVTDNLFSGLTVNLLLTSRSYTDKSNVIKYTGIAISPFNLSASIVNEQTLTSDSVIKGEKGEAGEAPLAVAWTNKVFSTASTGFATSQQESEVQAINTNSYTITANDSNVEYMRGDKVYPFLLGKDKVTMLGAGSLNYITMNNDGNYQYTIVPSVSSETKIELKLAHLNNGEMLLFYVYKSATARMYMAISNSKIRVYFGSNEYEFDYDNDTHVHTYTLAKEGLTVDDTLYSFSNTDIWSADVPLILMASSTSSGTSTWYSGKADWDFYYLKVYENEVLVADLVPYDDNDEGKFYDEIAENVVENEFSLAGGTVGTFTPHYVGDSGIDFTDIYTESGVLLTDIFDSQGFSAPYTELSDTLLSFSSPINLPSDDANDFYYTLLNSSATQANWEAAYWPLDVDNLTVTATDGNYTSRDVLSIVKSDAALLTYQYAMITATFPSDSDWSDIRQSGWYVGCSYWMRIKYTWEDGTETYSTPWEDKATNELMLSNASLEISSDKQFYEKDLRSPGYDSVVFTATSNRYINPTYIWVINNIQYTGDTVSFSYLKSSPPSTILASCTLTSLVGSTTYRATKTMTLSYIDVTQYNTNYGILTSDPSTGIEGDSYVKQVGDDYYPYAFVNGEWTQITNVANYPKETAQCRDVILANGINVKETSAALYGYFRNLSAQYAQIDYLSTETISLQNGGVIKSDNYAEDQYGSPTTGFYMDYDGTSKFVNSTIVDATISGSFTSDPLETRDEDAGSTITGSWGSTAYYNDGTVYDAVANNTTAGTLTSISSGTRTYGNSTISNVLRLTDDTQRTSKKTLASLSNLTGSSSTNGTLPVNCNNCSVSGTAIKKTLNTYAYSGTRTATMQYSLDNTNWTTFTGSVSGLSRSYGQSIYVRQVYDSSSVSVGSPTSWTTQSGPSASMGTAYGNGIIVAVGGGSGYGSIYTSTDGGNSWTQTCSTSSQFYDVAFGNGVFVASGYQVGLYRSTDGINWTFVQSSSNGNCSRICFGNGKFRTSGNAGNIKSVYESTDGLSWTTVTGTYLSGYVAGGNGYWYHTQSGIDKVTFQNGQFILTKGNSNGQVQVSSNGSSWTTKTTISEVYGISKVVYANGYYFLYKGSATGVKVLLYSRDLISWSTALSGVQASYGGVYANGKVIFNGQNNILYVNSFASYSDSDWTVNTNGSLNIQYDYSYYPIGANLLNSSNGILATKQNNYYSWDTTKTTISTYSLNPTAYYKFNGFSEASFDSRSYVANTAFTVKYTKFDGSSVSLTSPTSGNYTYNLKWNGTNFYIFLNGSQVGNFTTGDYFTGTRTITFTPMSQTDAILVKDIIPKTDSTYTIGESGREFLTAYIDNLYAVNVSGDLKCNYVSGSTTINDLAIYSLRYLYVGSGSQTITVGTGSYYVNGSALSSGGSISITGPALVSVFRYE